MRISISPGLHYPFTIRKITKRVGDEIQPRDALFTYTYTTKVTQQERYSEEETVVDKTFSAHFTTAIEGTIKTWFVWEGDVITGPRDVCEVEEPCKHSVQYAGFCVDCGKDMTGIDAVNDANPVRANIQGAHDSDKLLISEEEANDVDNESKKRLLAARKLSLVVDLDQTIIHAAVDPTIGEWQRDPENPNYEAVKDVRPFQLVDESGSKQECWYYIKLRPGLEDFLESIAEKYELHIYTMGTRQYAKKIAELVDPDGRYFGDRILSRDESGSMHAKNLARIFPVDTRMVVIIDDRADVWKWSANLIRVSQFEFFSGIGDINAGYLAKKQDIQTTEALEHATSVQPSAPTADAANGQSQDQEKELDEQTSGTLNGESTATSSDQAIPSTETDTPPLQQVIAMTDTANEADHVKSTDEAIASQLEDKPLLKLQQRMDEKDGIDTAEPTSTQNTESDSSDSETSSNSGKRRHGVLRNDDEELIYLERSLQAVHDRFFVEFDRKRNPRSAGKGGRLGELAGKQKAPLPHELPDIKDIPDVKQIMPAMKRRVLEGVTIVFSSVVPLKHDIQNADIALWAKSFGAQISDKITKETTHLVAARVGTAKVKTAVKKGIKVVGTDWLFRSIQRWKKLDERPFMLKGIGQKEMPAEEVPDEMEDSFVNAGLLGISEAELSSEDDTAAIVDTDDNDDEQPKKKRPKLDLSKADDDATDDEDPLQSPQVALNADDWNDINDEMLAEFGSDLDSESDAESIRSDRSTLSIRRAKRTREDDTEEESGNSDTELRNGDGHASKRQRSSALRAVKNAEPVEMPKEQTKDEYDEELALAMEAELEKDF